METIILNSHQKLLAPLELSSELGLIKSPEEIQQNIKISYILTGALVTITLILIMINLNEHVIKNKINNKKE